MMSKNKADNFLWTGSEILLVLESVESFAERWYKIEAVTRQRNVPDHILYHLQSRVILFRISKALSTGLPQSSVIQTRIRYEKLSDR